VLSVTWLQQWTSKRSVISCNEWHIENSKNHKKVILFNSTLTVRRCDVMVSVMRSMLKMLQPKIANNSLKTSLLRVQGRSKSSMLINLKSPSTVLVMISSMSVSIRNRFHTKRANGDKIVSFWESTPFWRLRSRGNPHLGARIFRTKTRVLGAAYNKDFVIRACTVLIQCQSVTDGQTNGQTDV